MFLRMSFKSGIKMLFLTVWICYVIGLTRANYGSPSSTVTENIAVEPGQNFHDLCYSTGDDTADIYWSKPDGERVKEGQGSNVYSSQAYGRLLLTILDLDQADEGVYACQEISKRGDVTILRRFFLHILANSEPRFEIPYVLVEVHEGENITLVCEALGDQPIQYNWLDPHSSDITNSSSNAVIEHRGNRSELYLLEVSSEAGGVYTCVATNHLSVSSKLFELIIRANEGYLTARVQNVTHSSVTFELIARDISAVRGFEVRYTLFGKGNFSSLHWLVGEEYKVTGLLPGAKYSFEIRILSSNNWTDAITVALPPGPPEIIVRQVTGNRLNMEFFRPFYLFSYNSIQSYIIKYRTVQQVGGNTWSYRDCEVTIELPSCYGSSYEISNLGYRVYYSITVQAVGPGGYSEPSEMKIYIP